jgi:hypothetical protein
MLWTSKGVIVKQFKVLQYDFCGNTGNRKVRLTTLIFLSLNCDLNMGHPEHKAGVLTISL